MSSLHLMKYPEFKKHYLHPTLQPSAGASAINWIKVLVDNKLKIDWQFIPRALYVTFMTSLFTPFRFLEKMKYDNKVKNTSILPPIFIIGHFRSGTTFLHYLLGQDKNLAHVTTLETMTPWVFLRFEKFFGNIVKKYLPAKRPMDDLKADIMLPYEEEYAIANIIPQSFYNGWYFPKNIDTYFKKYVLYENVTSNIVNEWKESYLYLLRKISYKNKGKRIVLKSPVNTAKIKHILDIFPEAQFIHIYRDPLKVYLSTWRLYEKILPIFSFQHITLEKLDEFIISFYKGLYKKYFLEKSCIPQENLVELKYENFYKNPVKNLKAVYDSLNINHFESNRVNFERFAKPYENYEPNHYKIDNGVKEKICKEWGFAFKEFQYEC